jgi:hypothetical protein
MEERNVHGLDDQQRLELFQPSLAEKKKAEID